MKSIRLSDKSGFTFVQTLVTVGLFSLVSAGALNIFLMAGMTIGEGNAHIGLQRSASIMVERVVRGVQGAGEVRFNGLSEANSITIPQIDRIDFTTPFDGLTRRFFVNGNDILYDPDLDTMGDEITIYDPDAGGAAVDYITQLSFVQVNATHLTITLDVGQRVNSRWVRAQYQTGLTLRNII